MKLNELIPNARFQTGAVFTYEHGASVRRPYTSLHDDAIAAQQKLLRWGVRSGMRVGIYAPNSYLWLVHDLALIAIGAISVPFTDDFMGAINEELLSRYGISLFLTSRKHAHLLDASLRHVALMDDDREDVQVAERSGLKEYDTDDTLSLAFSSGSEGGIKGLVISRKGAESTLPPIVEAIGASQRDRLLLFLPMSNFQQRMLCYAALWKDFDIIIVEYSNFFLAMSELRPTALLAPPIFYHMICSQLTQRPAWKNNLHAVLGSALCLLPSSKIRRAIAGFIFADFYRQVGKDMRVLITGMAPTSRSVAEFFRRMQLPLSESYGLMETGSLTYRAPEVREDGSVGRPIRGVDISIAADGEIIVRREHPLTLRYFQCADGENERTFIGNGMIATGDIGKIDSAGNLYLVGRKGDVITTPGGYKIHPSVVEEELNKCPGVIHSVVFMRGNAHHITCVVVLDSSQSEEVKARVRKFASEMKTTKKVTQFVEVVFANEPFSAENGMLRPNLKVDRRRIVARYGT